MTSGSRFAAAWTCQSPTATGKESSDFRRGTASQAERNWCTRRPVERIDSPGPARRHPYRRPDDGVDAAQASECEKVDAPSRELVEEARGVFHTPLLPDDAGEYDPRDIGDDRHRDGRGDEEHRDPSARHGQVRPRGGPRKERDQRPDAAAGLGDPETELAQVDDVAVEKDGNADPFEDR